VGNAAGRRALIVGCGAVFEKIYRPALERLERRGWIKVVAVVDPATDVGRSAASWFRGVHWYNDLADTPWSDFDVAFVLSPTDTHVQSVVSLVENGIEVLCEKPLGVSRSDIAEIARAADAANKRVCVAMIRRHFDTYCLLQL
jgi:predicted dehydrogenase